MSQLDILLYYFGDVIHFQYQDGYVNIRGTNLWYSGSMCDWYAITEIERMMVKVRENRVSQLSMYKS